MANEARDLVDSRRMTFDEYALCKRMTTVIPEFRSRLMQGFIRPGMKVLDVGCGDGVHLEFLCALTSKDNLVGAEVSFVRMKRVKEKGFRCVLVDGARLPFGAESFDAVVLFEVIEHISTDATKVLLNEIGRVLKSNGVIIGSTPNYPIKKAYQFVAACLVLAKFPLKVLAGILSKPWCAPRPSTPPMPLGRKSCATQCVATMGKLRALFLDDPTHVLFYNFKMLHEMGSTYFGRTRLYTTFRSQPKLTQHHLWRNRFSKKIAFLFQKEGCGSV